MSITDKRDQVVEIIRYIKEEKVQKTHDPDQHETNIHNVAHGWRGDQLVVAIFPSGLAADSALDAARTAAIGFGCDSLALTTETYLAGTPNSPLTGKRWGPGEMQQVADQHGGLETGAVVEAMTTIIVNRAGDISGASQQYRIHRRENALKIVSYTIEWLTEIGGDDPLAWQGRVPECLTRFMNEASVDVLMARDGISGADFGLDTDQARTHMDCAVVKTLYRSDFEGAVLLMADENQERAAIIEKSLGHLAKSIGRD